MSKSFELPGGVVVRTFPPVPAGLDLKHADMETLRRHGIPPRPRDPGLASLWKKSVLRHTRQMQPSFQRVENIRLRRHAQARPQAARLQGLQPDALPVFDSTSFAGAGITFPGGEPVNWVTSGWSVTQLAPPAPFENASPGPDALIMAIALNRRETNFLMAGLLNAN